MSDRFILHHYEGSPFAQKARLMLGFKGLPWTSVDVPVVMPKPDVVALTGGYRRTPLLQRGATVLLHEALASFEQQLIDGRAWLFGDEASIADFSLAHNLWFVRRAGSLAAILTPYAKVSAWLDRMLAIGRGTFTEMASGDAVLMAAAASAHVPTQVLAGLGYEAGARVSVAASDYGTDAAVGTLVGLTADEVVIERHDERAGTVHVHFPRAGYRIGKADKEGAR